MALVYEPHEYQAHAESCIIDKDQFGLLLDMGLGKTVIILSAIIKLLFKSKLKGRILIVAPLRVAQAVWRQEARKWSHTGNLSISLLHGPNKEDRLYDNSVIHLINYDGLKWLDSQLTNGKFNPYDMIVLDESTMIKNPSTVRFKILRRLSKNVCRRYILTGTPTPNSLLDFWSQIHFLDQGQRLGTSFTRYKQRFFYPIDYQGYKWVPKPGALEAITKLTSDIVLRLSAKDYLDLPDIMVNVVPVVLNKYAMETYKQMERLFFLELEEMEGPLVAQLAVVRSMKCRQLAAGFIYDEDRKTHEVHGDKLIALDSILEEHGEGGIVVVYEFKAQLASIKEHLKTEHKQLRVEVIETGQKEDVTNNILAWWDSGAVDILLVHPQANSYGLNLQAGGNTMVWLSPTFSLLYYLQLVGRIHRQGQEHPVIIHMLTAVDTVDVVALHALKGKRESQDSVLDLFDQYRKGILEI